FTAVDDSTNLYSAAGFIRCKSDWHAEPGSTQEVSDVLRELHEAGRPFKVRATRRGRHTPNRFACPGASASARLPDGQNPEWSGGSATPASAQSVTLLLHRMNNVVAVDYEARRLTVQAGMTVQNLADAAVRNGLSVPVGVFPVYGNLTLGGLVAASAHGTGAGVASSLGDILTGVKWVDSTGAIIHSDVATETGLEQIRALIGGLGLLGIMTELTLQLLPAGSLAQVETWVRDDANLAADIRSQLATSTPHVLIFWRPDLRYYKAYHYKPLEAGDVPRHPYWPDGRGGMLSPAPPQSNMTDYLAAYTADFDESGPQSDFLNAQGCALGDSLMNLPGFRDETSVLYNATIPSSHATFSEECSPHCIWEVKSGGYSVEDNELHIRLSRLEEFLDDVRSIIKAEEQEKQEYLDRRYGKGKVSVCLPPGFFWIRFGKGTQNLLATTAGFEEPVLYFMTSFLVSGFSSYLPTKLDHIAEVIEQVGLCKYGARPHYGKNFDRLFAHPECHVRDNFPPENFPKMLELQKKHDPNKVFEPELVTRMVERRGPVYGDKCALRRECYCKEDSHCADGFKCQPSASYPEFKACKVQYPKQKEEHHSEPKQEL
ncbi:hypothetical protein MARPO_2307s0001, partial [Marchantia polymorpha]